MQFELPVIKNRREVLASPEIMRVNAEGMKLSIITKSLLAFTLALLYSMFMYGSIRTILTSTSQGKNTLIKAFAVLAVFATIAVAILIPLIFKNKIKSLIFTETGLLGPGLFNVKYDNVGTYGWEVCRGILATGQVSKEKKITLRLTSNKGLFPDLAFIDRFGNSILGNFGYFFTADQIKQAEEIMNRKKIKKVPDRT